MLYVYPDTGYAGVMWDSPIMAYPLKTLSTVAASCFGSLGWERYFTVLLQQPAPKGRGPLCQATCCTVRLESTYLVTTQ